MSIISHWTCGGTQATSVDMNQVTPSTIRYIKLGAGGCWEGALERGRLEWGGAADAHVAGLEGNWDAVHAGYVAQGVQKATATGYTNEARLFFGGDTDLLWITFARGRMWWTFAEVEVHATEGGGSDTAGAYYRVARGGWRDTDINGEQLTFERLSTLLTKVSAYQRTICSLSADQAALCLRYIYAPADPLVLAVAQARDALRDHLTLLIQRLAWNDFEQLVDLALGRTGWVRVSDLGKTGKDIDLLVEQPFTRERMAVQVKSSATQQVVDDYARRLGERSAGERSLLICHSPVGELRVPDALNGRRLELVLGDAVTDLSINAGLIDWIVQRAR